MALEANRKKVAVTVDAAEVDSRIKAQYKDFARKYHFPGFRKGKAPRPVIDSVLGKEAVAATVTEDIISSLYPLALDDNDLVVMGQPEFEDTDDMVEQGKPYRFAFTVETRPEFELVSYEPLSVKLPSEEPTEEEIDGQIKELLDYYYTFEDCADDAQAGEGGFVEVALDVKDAEGQDVAALSTDSRLYEMGGGLFPKSFDEALMDMRKGDAKTVEIDFSEPSMMASSLEGVGACTVEIEVKQLKEKVLPELDDEWAKTTAGFEGGVKELRERVASSVKEQKQGLFSTIRENEALYALQERLQGEPPAGMAEQQEQELLQNFFMQIQQSGLTFDQYLAQNGLTPETFHGDLKRQAADVVAQDLALDAWARHNDIQVSDADITAEFEKSGVEDPAALEKEWREQGRIAGLRASIKRSRAIEDIVSSLQVETLAPGEKLNSARASEASEDAASAASEQTASAKDAKGAKHTKTELNKMKVAELREYADSIGVESKGLKKAELVEAVLAAE